MAPGNETAKYTKEQVDILFLAPKYYGRGRANKAHAALA